MNKKNKIRFVLALSTLLSLTSCGSIAYSGPLLSSNPSSTSTGSSSAITRFTITFVDDDGTVLQTEQLPVGALPTCVHPAKKEDSENTYVFKEWSPAIVPVKENATYRAVYLISSKNYTVGVSYGLNDDGASYTAFNYGGIETSIVVASYYKGYPVTAIGGSTFADKERITEIVLPKKLTTIGAYAFSGCKALTSLAIPDTITSVGYEAFYNCKALAFNDKDGGHYVGNTNNPYLVLAGLSTLDKTLAIPATTKVYAERAGKETHQTGFSSISVDAKNTAFSSDGRALFNHDKTTLLLFAELSGTSYVIPEGVKTLANGAFAYDTSLLGITFPSSLKALEKEAFYDCTHLAQASINEGLEEIGDTAFGYCALLKEIVLPDSVTNIGINAFSDNLSLTLIHLGANLTELKAGSFARCGALTSLAIPEHLVTISPQAFEGCTALASFSVDKANTAFSSDGRSLFNKADQSLITYADASGSDYTIPDGITSIQALGFFSLSHLVSVVLPTSLKTLYPQSFDHCSALTNISLSNAITAFPADTFFLCKELTTLTYPGTQAEWAKLEKAYNWAEGCSKLTSVICTDGTVSL